MDADEYHIPPSGVRVILCTHLKFNKRLTGTGDAGKKRTVMGKKIAAWVIALLVIVFPFRRAFLSDEEPGFMMILSFIITLIGIAVFYYLTMEKHGEEGSH